MNNIDTYDYKDKLPTNFNIETIIKWLEENRKFANSLVYETTCAKWRNSLKFKSPIFPCLCKQRYGMCFFTEVYDELNKIAKVYEHNTFCKNAVEDFKSFEKKEEWLLKYKKTIGFYSEKKFIKYGTPPYQYYEIELNTEEFRYIIEYGYIVFEIENPEP